MFPFRFRNSLDGMPAHKHLCGGFDFLGAVVISYGTLLLTEECVHIQCAKTIAIVLAKRSQILACGKQICLQIVICGILILRFVQRYRRCNHGC